MERAYRRPDTLAGSESPGRSSSRESVRPAGAADGPLNEARGALREVFGFEGFRPGQEAAIEALLEGRHALTVMPTGSGKSLCFQIPALVMEGLTVVVSPPDRPDAGPGVRAPAGGRCRRLHQLRERQGRQRRGLAPGGGGQDAASIHGRLSG